MVLFRRLSGCEIQVAASEGQVEEESKDKLRFSVDGVISCWDTDEDSLIFRESLELGVLVQGTVKVTGKSLLLGSFDSLFLIERSKG